MSHVVIIIDRAPPPSADVDTHPAEDQIIAHVEFTPPDAMSEADVVQHVRKLYRQVRNLGTDNS